MGQWTNLMTELLPWILGIGVPVIGGLFTLWLRVESKQDRAISQLQESNDEAHTELRKAMTDQHSKLRDKIEQIWQHLVHHDSGNKRDR
jgi:hypothetical protein